MEDGDQSMLAVGDESQDAVPDQARPLVSLDILQYVKQAQAQHGLRHSDYKRYRCSTPLRYACPPATIVQAARACCRQYCARKAHRTRKALKLTHGRGKFQPKSLEAGGVTDAK